MNDVRSFLCLRMRQFQITVNVMWNTEKPLFFILRRQSLVNGFGKWENIVATPLQSSVDLCQTFCSKFTHSLCLCTMYIIFIHTMCASSISWNAFLHYRQNLFFFVFWYVIYEQLGDTPGSFSATEFDKRTANRKKRRRNLVAQLYSHTDNIHWIAVH